MNEFKEMVLNMDGGIFGLYLFLIFIIVNDTIRKFADRKDKSDENENKTT